MARLTSTSRLSHFVLACLLTFGLERVFGAAAPGVSHSAWIPEQAALSVEVFRPDAFFAPLLTPEFARKVTGLPAYERGRSTKPIQDILGLAQLMETTSQTNWQSVVRALTQDGLAFAVGAGDRSLFIMGGKDSALLEKLHSVARQIAVSETEKQGQTDLVRSKSYGSATGWTFNGKEAHALVGSRLLAASDDEVLRRALELGSGGSGPSLANRTDYQAARAKVGKDAVAMVFLDLQQLRQIPHFLKSLEEQRQNPLAALLLGGVTGPLKSSPWLALGVYVEAESLAVRSFVPGETTADAVPAFARTPSGTNGLQPNLTVPRQVAAISLFRDLAGFYAAKDTLFPQRTSGLIFFENMMGIFFTGRNLTDEVLAQIQPRIRIVAARQDFDPAIGTPDPQLPAFAFVFELRDPKAFDEVVEEAWQKALGLVNFTRGQKALPGLILDRVPHHGVTMTVARYSAKEAPDRQHLDSRFNLSPTLALVKGHAILSSTEQLAGDIIDAMSKDSQAESLAAAGANSSLQLRGRELETILKANRGALVQGNMLKDGKTQSEAEATIDTLCTLAGWVDRVSFRGDGVGASELRFTFSSP